MPDRRRFCRNTSRQSPTAMERLDQRFRVTQDRSVTKALCNELVSELFDIQDLELKKFLFSKWTDPPGE